MEFTNIDSLYDALLENNVDMQLKGSLSCDDEIIIWEYDGMSSGYFDLEEHLVDVFEMDKETIEDFMFQENSENHIVFQEPEYLESIVRMEILLN